MSWKVSASTTSLSIATEHPLPLACTGRCCVLAKAMMCTSRNSLSRVEPSAQVRWLRDIYGNSIAMIKFLNPADRLVISSSAEVSHFEEELFDFEVEPSCDRISLPV